jgi:hypothetical protein
MLTVHQSTARFFSFARRVSKSFEEFNIFKIYNAVVFF